VTGALLYLTARRLANRTRILVRRARRPKYLLIYALGATYLWVLLVGRHAPRAGSPATAAGIINLMAPVYAMFLARWWLFPTDTKALAFTPAEVQFLFPAPLTRGQLLHFRLMRHQLVMLFSTLIWTLILRRSGAGTAPDLLRALALWVLFSTLFLQRLGAALTRAAALEHGWAGLRRRKITLLVAAVVLAAAAFTIWEQGHAFREAGPAGILDALSRIGGAAPLSVALWPIRALLQPVFESQFSNWAGAMLPAIVILGLSYLWVMTSDHAFEQAAVEASARRARRLSSAAGASAGTPSRRWRVPLRHDGRPGDAISWKNLVSALRTLEWPAALAVGIPLAGGAIFVLVEPGMGLREVLGWFALVWLLFVLLAGPQWVRFDLRRDLRRMDLLRSAPLSGRAIVTGEVTATAMVLSLYQTLLMVVALIGLARSPDLGIPEELFQAIGLTIIPLFPLLNVFSVGVQNAGAMLFPEWVRSERHPGGVAALGQTVIGLVATAILLGLALAAPLAAAWLLWLAGGAAIGGWAIVAGGVTAGLLLAAEAWLLLGWLGGIFDRFDAAEALLSPEP
jgi:ABC-2 type transport system permease protein